MVLMFRLLIICATNKKKRGKEETFNLNHYSEQIIASPKRNKAYIYNEFRTILDLDSVFFFVVHLSNTVLESSTTTPIVCVCEKIRCYLFPSILSYYLSVRSIFTLAFNNNSKSSFDFFSCLRINIHGIFL